MMVDIKTVKKNCYNCYLCTIVIKSLKFYPTESRWLLHATEIPVAYSATHHDMEEQKRKRQPESIWKCVLLILFPRGGVGLFRIWVRNEGRVSHQSMTRLHLSSLNTIMCNHSYIQYNTPAQPRKHWLYTNKTSNLL